MALFFIPKTQAESGVLAKIRPAHMMTKREHYSHKQVRLICKAFSMNMIHFGVPLLLYSIVSIIRYVTLFCKIKLT